VPVRGPFLRLLWGIGVVGAGGLALIGGFALRGPGLVGVAVAAVLVACAVVGLVREAPVQDHRSLARSAVQASAWTAGVLVMLAGVAALAGGLVAILAGAVGLSAWLAVRVAGSRKRLTQPGGPAPTGRQVPTRPVRPPGRPSSAPAHHAAAPVSVLTTSAIGQEWLRTSAALGGRLRPADRVALVQRREETLDELERRDPAGFACWLADGPAPGSDPAAYIRGRSVQGDPTTGTDAA
jgi:hypothetical protein